MRTMLAYGRFPRTIPFPLLAKLRTAIFGHQLRMVSGSAPSDKLMALFLFRRDANGFMVRAGRTGGKEGGRLTSRREEVWDTLFSFKLPLQRSFRGGGNRLLGNNEAVIRYYFSKGLNATVAMRS